MAISDIAVHLGIKAALLAASGRTVADRLENAWRQVNRLRLAGNCNDDLAAVEHYLYTRFLVARYGPLVYHTLYGMDLSYRALKLLHLIYPFVPVPQEGSCPPSPLSLSDWRWTITGIQDGWADFLGLTDLSSLRENFPEHPRSLWD